MIRFVIRRKMMYRGTGLQTENLETVDCNAPELERVLQGGGHDDHGAYDYREVIGTEILPDAAQADRLRRFLDVAAGEGLVLDGVDAAELYLELFGAPKDPT
jgi:hypothetical protein